ncbi:MAG: chromate transporter [Anaerofustis stercorihominis]|nr:chromate transporter [Anaerofustis stercorihominis]
MNVYLDLFLTFFKIGLFTIGGGYAMIPMMQDEVTTKGWASIETVIDFIAVSESTPGPFAVNMATFIGAETGGFFGAVCSTLGVVLPSFIIILIIAKFFATFAQDRRVKAVLYGIRPVVVGLIGVAAFSIAEAAFLTAEGLNFVSLGIFTVAFAFYKKFPKIHPVFIVFLSMALGMLFYGIVPMIF